MPSSVSLAATERALATTLSSPCVFKIGDYSAGKVYKERFMDEERLVHKARIRYKKMIVYKERRKFTDSQ
jgi:hypothetical protein